MGPLTPIVRCWMRVCQVRVAVPEPVTLQFSSPCSCPEKFAVMVFPVI